MYKRPIFPPLSIAKVIDDNSYYDVALFDNPILINKKAPQFDIDWKDDSDVKEDFGWVEPSKELRVRTAIDMKTRRAKEDKLFAYEMIVSKGYHWLTYIDFGSVPENEREAVKRQLRELLEYGLSGLGKTKAEVFAEVKEYSNIQPYYESNPEPICGHYIITLQTPAIICDPSKLNEASGKGELFNAYMEAWNDISDNSLSLVRYFARQSLAGGYYIHRRFQEGKKYKPYLLTDAGSVFVLKTVDEGAKEKIRDWLDNGLPLPKWAKEEYKRDNKEGDHWSNCPYIRENGYGEIAVNLDIHKSKMPKEESVCQITGYGE